MMPEYEIRTVGLKNKIHFLRIVYAPSASEALDGDKAAAGYFLDVYRLDDTQDMQPLHQQGRRRGSNAGAK